MRLKKISDFDKNISDFNKNFTDGKLNVNNIGDGSVSESN